MTIPDFRPGMKVTAQMFTDIWKQLRRQRITFSEAFTFSETAGGTVVDLSATSSSTIVKFAVATGAISASSSKATFPVTYGSGNAKLDIDGTTTATQSGTTITIKNRFPTAWSSGDLFVVRSNDGGATWYIIERYCP